MKKKGISYFLMAAFFAACILGLAGCSQKKTAEQNSTENKIVTIEFSYPPYGYDSQKEDAFWKKYIAEFEKENPNIKVNFTVESWDNVYTKWDGYFASGDTPDIGYADGVQGVEYGVQGKALPLTDVIDALGGEEVFTKDSKAFQTNGVWYSIPNCVAAPVLAYRKDLLKAAGFSEPPKTWDELVSMSKKLTKDGVYGLGMFTGENLLTQQIMVGFMKAAGGRVLDEKGNVVVNCPENLEALKFMTDLAKVHKVVPPSAVDWKYGDDVNVLGTGKVATDIMWGGYGTLLESMFPNDYQNIGFVTMPVGPSGHSGSFTGSGGFFLFNKAEHPKEAKEFIKFMSREEISKEWCKISGNVSPFKSIANDPELMKMEWYKAVSQQSDTAVELGFDYGFVPGLDILHTQYRYSRTVGDVLLRNMTPEEALKTLHDDCIAAIEKAKKQ